MHIAAVSTIFFLCVALGQVRAQGVPALLGGLMRRSVYQPGIEAVARLALHEINAISDRIYLDRLIAVLNAQSEVAAGTATVLQLLIGPTKCPKYNPVVMQACMATLADPETFFLPPQYGPIRRCTVTVVQKPWQNFQQKAPSDQQRLPWPTSTAALAQALIRRTNASNQSMLTSLRGEFETGYRMITWTIPSHERNASALKMSQFLAISCLDSNPARFKRRRGYTMRCEAFKSGAHLGRIILFIHDSRMYASTLIAIVASFVAVSQAAVIMSYPSPVVYSKGIEFIAQKAIEQINIQSSDSYVEQIVAVLGAQSAPSGGTTVEFLVGPTTCMKDGFVPGACSLFDPTLTEVSKHISSFLVEQILRRHNIAFMTYFCRTQLAHQQLAATSSVHRYRGGCLWISDHPTVHAPRGISIRFV
ncbi:unnamed protein product [Anisakis simplex]|uniref:ANF_receptor domain-containing protein n=1 Tax=Anisakis simplex TaxID=6269 RepID=A0A0M3JV00_ANISI|nr:unnamed protein product [Anisakis simplex]